MFNEAETKYWPTELKMAGLIWVIRKIRHLIETAKETIIIFSDHAANILTTKQTIFASNNIDKLNFRLVRTSIYLSQFRFNVKYRPGKKHVILDVLSRLSSNNGPTNSKLLCNFPAGFLNLDINFCGIFYFFDDFDCYVFQNFYINMSDTFK